tara:strand:+ start:287 stop:565 length:279 start_codon:yes stop_codon:yes gene_type:complete
MENLKLKSIAKNQTEVTLNDETTVFFSYETPVAAMLSTQEGWNTCLRFVKTSKKWGPTTTRHINKWLESKGIEKHRAKELEQDFFNNLLEEC